MPDVNFPCIYLVFSYNPYIKSIKPLTKPIIRYGGRDHRPIMFDSGIKIIWKMEEKAKVQDCVHYFVNE